MDPFGLPFFQRGIAEVLLLAVVAGFLGTWIVLRGLAFFAHAAGTATFPGLVLADGLGFAAALGAFGAALLTAALVGLAARRRGVGTDGLTALVLAGALALGVVLASDVFASQANVDRLLFGSLLTIDAPDLRLAAITALAAVAASVVAGPRWLARGFAGEHGRPEASRAADALLVVLVALAAVAAVAAAGALLATAILVVPAATTRLVTSRLRTWQAATVALAAAQGVLGMWAAYALNVPPGAAIAVLAGAVFALTALGAGLARRRPPRAGRAVAVAAALGALGLAGCGGSGGDAGTAADGTPRITVAATTTQVADLVRQIGGEAVDVQGILQPNSEAHDYEPRPKDVAKLADARVVFTSGLGLDAWSADLVKDSGTGADVVDLADGLPVRRPVGEQGHDHEDGHDHGSDETDPHWWHDPRNVEAAATRIERALIAADPGARERISANARAFRARARALDRAIAACVKRVPASERRIVTDHDAFTYFTSRYGIRSVGAVIPSQSSQGQTSAGDLAALERTIREQGVKAVFPESSLNPRIAERLAQDTGVTARFQLYGDTLGERGTPAGTVLGASAANARALVRGMSGGTRTCDLPS